MAVDGLLFESTNEISQLSFTSMEFNAASTYIYTLRNSSPRIPLNEGKIAIDILSTHFECFRKEEK